MVENNNIPGNILKIQKKLSTYQKDSRNYKKYTKILARHIKNYNMQNRVKSNIKTIETIKTMEDSVK